MKYQRKSRFESEVVDATRRRAFCSPDENNDHREIPANKYSPGVLITGWQTAAARKRENDEWYQHRDCGRCSDLRGAYCTWKPDVILRRNVRDSGYLYDRPPFLGCQDREPAQECRLLHRKQLKSLYDQHYNEHPSTQPAHVNCPDLLPEGPTNFGLLDKMALKWQNEIAGLVALRTGPSLYRESYQGHTKDNGTFKEKHVSCMNDFRGNNSFCLKTNKATQTTDSMTTFGKPNPAELDTCDFTKVLSDCCRQEAAPCHCENTRTFLPCDRHSTTLDCGGNHDNVSANCSAARKSSAESDCVLDSSVQAVEIENPKFNARNELAGAKEWQLCNETGTRIQKGEPRIELTERKAAEEREFHCWNNDDPHQFEPCKANDASWNVSELESDQRKDAQVWEFLERNAAECDFRGRNLEDCDYPGIQTTLPFMPTKGAEHRDLVTGSARKAFPEIGSTGNYVHGPGLDQEIDRKFERTGQRYNPPSLPSARFVTALNSRHDACHSCLNLSVL